MEGEGARHKRLLVLQMERGCLWADTGGHSGPPSLFGACNLCGDAAGPESESRELGVGGGARGKQQLVLSGGGCPLENHLQNSGGPSRPGAEQPTPSLVLGPLQGGEEAPGEGAGWTNSYIH